jgi:hypothetical protein
MAITKHSRHDDCEVQIKIGPFGPHHAQLYCTKHNTHIQWLSKDTVTILEDFYQPKAQKKGKRNVKNSK